MQVSTHFTLEEFTKLDHHKLFPLQYLMIQNLALTLETIRELTGSRIKIRSGVRTIEDFNRLQKEGYRPSPVSDHFFGFTIPLSSAKHRTKFGDYFTMSVGAVDFECMDTNTEKAYHILYKNRHSLSVGQLILEKKNTFWIHVSNPYTLIYSQQIQDEYLKKDKYLVSLNNGESFIPFDLYLKRGF